MRAHTVFLAWLALGCSGDDPDTVPDDTAPVELNLEGAVYTLDVSELNVVDADPGLASVIRLFFTRTVLVGLHTVSDDQLSLRLGFAADGTDPVVQDVCTQTLELPAADRSSPFAFDVGPETTTFQGAELTYSIQDLALSGTLSDTGSQIRDIVLEGGIDLRQVEALGFGTAVDLCSAMADLGLPCGACDDNEALCATLWLDGLTASRVGATMEAIDSLDPVDCPTPTD